MNTKSMRKEAVIGLLLLGLYLVLRIFPRSGLLMTLLLIAGLVLLVGGMLPDKYYQKFKQAKDNLLKKK